MSRDRPEPAHGHGHGHGSRPGQEPARSRRPASMIQRLWRALAAFILLLTGAGALIYFGLQRQDQTIHLVVRRLQPLEAANLRVRSDFSTSQAILQGRKHEAGSVARVSAGEIEQRVTDAIRSAAPISDDGRSIRVPDGQRAPREQSPIIGSTPPSPDPRE